MKTNIRHTSSNVSLAPNMPPRPLSATFDQPLSPYARRSVVIPEELDNDRARLTPAEEAWSAHQDYLESNGFVLRPRLRRGWKPSWLGTSDDPLKHEDSIRITELGIVDAARASDGAQVVLKAVRSQPAENGLTLGQPNELGILKYLHSPPYTGHTCNHAVQLLGSIPMPETTEGSFAVLPLLRVHDDPSFLNVGEAVEFIKQILRGLAFLHAQNVAHRDVKPSNIMMAGEVLFDEPFHPVAQSLSLDAKTVLRPRARHELDSHRRHDGESAVRYCFVNFSRASYLPPSTGTNGQVKPRMLRSTRGQLGRFPEAMLTVGHDPFKADVYCMGKYVIDELINRHLALVPFTSVARYMTRRDPRTRPTAAEAFAHFETIRGSLEDKCLNISLDSKGHTRPHLPMRSPRRAMSTMHISTWAPGPLHHPHGSWSSTDSARTLVAEISSPVKEILKGHEPVTRTIFGESESENKPLERKKSKSKWGAFRAAVKTIVR